MEKSLPKGWVISNIEESVAILDNMRKPVSATERAKRSGDIPYYGATGLAGYIDDYLFDEELVLIGEDGAPFFDKQKNVAFIITGKSWVNNHAHVLKAKNNTVNKFILHYLNQFDYTGFVRGTTRLKLTQGDLRKIPFPLPPLPEQERIVAKLDKLFAQHEKIKAALDRIPQLLKTFRQQVLTQAVTGKLTEQWREGKELEVKFELENSSFRAWKFSIPSRWRAAAYGDVADVKSNLVDPNSFSDYFLIAPDNIEVNTGRLINRPLVSEINPKSGKHLFDKGVIIYSKIRPYLNKLIIADFIGLCSADMYPIDKTVYTETKFIFYYMLSNEFLSYSTTAGERSVLPKINQKGLKEIPFPLPPLQEQQEIVRRVESLFTKADTIEARYLTLKAKIDSLPQAILHKAFKGELVSQLPTDGDAKDLLEEIIALKKETKGKRGKA